MFMPMERHLYPSNWNSLAFAIKQEANWTCQQCQRVCRKPGESKEDFLQRLGESNNVKIGQYTLTVAHLNHKPSDCSLNNLRAWCSVCHARYDLRQMPRKKYLKRERNGQLKLNLSIDELR
jgi:hypothetical protein